MIDPIELPAPALRVIVRCLPPSDLAHLRSVDRAWRDAVAEHAPPEFAAICTESAIYPGSGAAVSAVRAAVRGCPAALCYLQRWQLDKVLCSSDDKHRDAQQCCVMIAAVAEAPDVYLRLLRRYPRAPLSGVYMLEAYHRDDVPAVEALCRLVTEDAGRSPSRLTQLRSSLSYMLSASKGELLGDAEKRARWAAAWSGWLAVAKVKIINYVI